MALGDLSAVVSSVILLIVDKIYNKNFFLFRDKWIFSAPCYCIFAGYLFHFLVCPFFHAKLPYIPDQYVSSKKTCTFCFLKETQQKQKTSLQGYKREKKTMAKTGCAPLIQASGVTKTNEARGNRAVSACSQPNQCSIKVNRW